MSEGNNGTGWGGARAGSGKKKGSAGNPGSGRKPTGLKRVSFCVSCQPEELQQIKELAAGAGKTVSRFLLDAVLKD